MPVGQKEVTPEEATKIANRVGLNSVNWNGSMLSLVLMDGSAVEFNIRANKESGDIDLDCTHRTLRLNKTPTERY